MPRRKIKSNSKVKVLRFENMTRLLHLDTYTDVGCYQYTPP